jgi:hypothetical protein
MGVEDLPESARGESAAAMNWCGHVLICLQSYNAHSWGPLKVHFKRPETSRGVGNEEKKNGVGDAKDMSSVHDIKGK